MWPHWPFSSVPKACGLIDLYGKQKNHTHTSMKNKRLAIQIKLPGQSRSDSVNQKHLKTKAR